MDANDFVLRLLEQLESRLADCNADVQMLKKLIGNPKLLETLTERMNSNDLVE